MKGPKSFETERLWLTPISLSDAPFVLELMNTPKWIKYIGDRNVNSVQEAHEYIKVKMLPQLEKLGFSNYVVTRKLDQCEIGTCGLYDREGIDGVDIGFAFLPRFEKMGYGFESVNKLREVASSEFHIEEIKAITLKENISSQNLLTKIGLKFQKMIKIPNDSAELMLFSGKIRDTIK